jgi:hypothetical protein
MTWKEKQRVLKTDLYEPNISCIHSPASTAPAFTTMCTEAIYVTVIRSFGDVSRDGEVG